MARLILGGFSQDVVLPLDDGVCRALQKAVLTRIASGEGMSLRFARKVDGVTVISVSWVSPSTSMRFEWDGDLIPDGSQDLMESFLSDIEKMGGVFLPAEADLEFWNARLAADLQEANRQSHARKSRGRFLAKG